MRHTKCDLSHNRAVLDFDAMLNQAWIQFWATNRNEEFRNIDLGVFFPWRYDSQSDLTRFGQIEDRPETAGSERPSRPSRPSRESRPTRLTEQARDEEEQRLIEEAIDSGNIPITSGTR